MIFYWNNIFISKQLGREIIISLELVGIMANSVSWSSLFTIVHSCEQVDTSWDKELMTQAVELLYVSTIKCINN